MMNSRMNRRTFLGTTAVAAALAACANNPSKEHVESNAPLYRISLAEWSLHRTLFKKDITNLDFPLVARRDYGIDAVEYVNAFFKDKASDTAYLADLRSRAEGEGVKSLLIMIDGEGDLGAPDESARAHAVAQHTRWLEAAKALGCHSIRVNANSRGSREEQERLLADGFAKLMLNATALEMNVIVENHGGLSSDGDFLAGVMRRVGHPRFGTLPDFGNFNIAKDVEYDRYLGVSELMPFAKAVSAKSYDFDAQGNETRIDYLRMLRIVTASYHGHVGIEYEGDRLSEPEGIRATKTLLERVRTQLSS